MLITIFGSAGPTGLELCRQALAAGHDVRAVSRRTDPLPLPESDRWEQVLADAVTGDGVLEAVRPADAVLSVLGSSYGLREITVYSRGTRSIVEALRRRPGARRLIVVSSGLTYPPQPMSWAADHIAFPLLRHVVGRTLYADMRRMEEDLQACTDIAWTVMRPARLFDADQVSDYRVDDGRPTQGWTSRQDLAAAMLAEVVRTRSVHLAVSPTTDRSTTRSRDDRRSA